METTFVLEKSAQQIQKDVAIWHPYCQEQIDERPLNVVKAKGAKLFLDNGDVVLDAISSWWVNLHGHGHPKIQSAIHHQLETLEHVMLAGYTHGPAEDLAKELLHVMGPQYERVFFSDNGSTAVETGLKGIIQQLYNQNINKHKILTFYGGYHGDTLGCMSLSEKGLFSRPFNRFLFETSQVVPPIESHLEKSLIFFEEQLKRGDVAAFVFEPWIQGVGGMKKHSLEGLDQMLSLCKEYQVLTLADEVMTGMGRLGPYFVTHLLQNKPDVVCLAKALTGGFLPFAATLFKKGFIDAFQSDQRIKGFLHGHSYCGNPLGCVAALETLRLLQTQECTDQKNQIERSHLEFAEKIKGHKALSRVESTHTLLAFECHVTESSSYFHPLREKLLRSFKKQNVLIRPFGNTFHVLPPYCITQVELKQIYLAIENVLEELI